MARIPIPQQKAPTKLSGLDQRIDPGINDPIYQGAQAVAKGLDQLGQTIVEVDRRREDLNDRSIQAEIKLATVAAEESIAEYEAANPSNPKGIEKFAAEERERVEADINAKIRGMKTRRRQETEVEYEFGKKRFDASLKRRLIKAEIKDNNIKYKTLAEKAYYEGNTDDYDEAVAQLEMGEGELLEFKETTKRLGQPGAYLDSEQILIGINTVEGYTKFINEDLENNTRLSDNGRKALQNRALNQLKALERKHSTIQTKAIEAINARTFDPEVTAQQMLEAGMPEEQVLNVLRIAETAAAGESALSLDGQKIQEKLDGLHVGFITKLKGGSWFGASPDRAPAEYNKVLQAIAESDLSQFAKKEAYAQWVDIYAADVQEGQVEFDSFFGREIKLNEADKKMWGRLFEFYKMAGTGMQLSPQIHGEALIFSMKEFVEMKRAGEFDKMETKDYNQWFIKQRSRLYDLQIADEIYRSANMTNGQWNDEATSPPPQQDPKSKKKATLGQQPQWQRRPRDVETSGGGQWTVEPVPES
jgi:hypothetical protein